MMHFPAEISSILERQAAAAAPVVSGNDVFNMTSSLQQFGFAIIFFFPALAFICCCLRVYGRLSTEQLGPDDLLVCVAMLMSIGETAATYMFMKTNFIGIHFKDIPFGTYDPTPGLIWNFAVQVLYNPILALVKTSVLIFLLRLGGQKPGVRTFIHVLNVFNIALMVAIFLVVMFQCWPIAFNWNPLIANGHCVKQGTFYLVTAALTIFTDVLVLAIPIWIFADLKMKRKMKIALIFVFLLGFLVTIVGIVRLVFVYRAFFTTPGPNSDPTYTLGFCTSAIETNLAIVTASAPALWPSFRRWFPRLFSTLTGSSKPVYADTYGVSGNTHRSKATAGRSENRHSISPGMMLKDLKDSKSHTKVRSHSPSASEEEIMTYNGIMRTTAVRVSYGEGELRDDGQTEQGRPRPQRNEYGMRTSVSGSI